MAPATIYNVTHPRGHEARLRINDDVMRRANAREANYQRGVAMQFREHLKAHQGFDPGYIEFDDLGFQHVMEADSDDSDEYSYFSPSDFDHVREGDCVCACRGCDRMGLHCEQRESGCKV